MALVFSVDDEALESGMAGDKIGSGHDECNSGLHYDGWVLGRFDKGRLCKRCKELNVSFKLDGLDSHKSTVYSYTHASYTSNS